jgi:hypothetical protein
LCTIMWSIRRTGAQFGVTVFPALQIGARQLNERGTGAGR